MAVFEDGSAVSFQFLIDSGSFRTKIRKIRKTLDIIVQLRCMASVLHLLMMRSARVIAIGCGLPMLDRLRSTSTVLLLACNTL